MGSYPEQVIGWDLHNQLYEVRPVEHEVSKNQGCINTVDTLSVVRYRIYIVDTVLEGCGMQVTIKKWGNSPSVRIPAAVMKSAKLSLDSVVDVRVENGCVVIEPVYPQEIDLDTLVAGITPDNLHAEVDFDVAVGKEAF